jgi:hypothetical protein
MRCLWVSSPRKMHVAEILLKNEKIRIGDAVSKNIKVT